MMGGAIGIGSPKEITLAISYFLQAAKLDTSFAFAYLSAARQYGNLHYQFPDSAVSYRALILADSLYAIGKRLDTGGVNHHFFGSWLATVHGDYETAVTEANIYLQKRPEDYRGYMVLALAYDAQNKYELAAANWEETVKRNSMNIDALFSLNINLYRISDTLRLKKYSTQAVPLYRLAAIRHPDDKSLSTQLTWLLAASGNGDEACRRVDEQIKPPGDTPGNLYFAACVYALNNNRERAMELLNMSVQKGDILIMNFDQLALKNLRPLPEFQALVKAKNAAAAKKKNG
jgi:tetratricopeptide (TPR) repeat protein